MLSLNNNNVLHLSSDTGSVQFNHAITFCRDWLNGKQQFTFYTSGSTGLPKPIALNRAQLEASARATIRSLQLTSKEKIWICLNTQLIAGSMMLVRGMLLNSELLVTEPASDPLQHIPSNHEMTFASFVPMQLHRLLEDDAETIRKLNRFKVILVGGASIHPLLEDKLAALTCAAFHTYGMTETVSHIALKRIGMETCYMALPGVDLQTDERGCLCIRSAATNNQWIITNDMAELTGERQFVLLGRADEVINSGGIKIFPAKVETALHRCLADMKISVKNLFVAAEKDERYGEKLLAVIGHTPLSAEEENLLNEKLKAHLSAYEIPKLYLYSGSFAQTESGKTDKIATLKKLIERYTQPNKDTLKKK
jgi:O-succinylbenzoic acid--CoA ligase